MTNKERADAALTALGWYSVEKDGSGRSPVEKEEIGEAMTDLIADLEHLAKREEISFTGVLSMAKKHYVEERDGR